MTDWNQYARDVQAASNAAYNKDQKRIKELESKLAKAEKERDEWKDEAATWLAAYTSVTNKVYTKLAELEK